MKPGLPKVGTVRKGAAIVLAAVFLVSLAGCADLPQTVQNCTPRAQPGTASDGIKASGSFGNDPKADVPLPTVTKRVETSTIKTGNGQLLGNGDIAVVQLTIYDGKQGSVVGGTGTSGYTKTSLYQTTVGNNVDHIGVNLLCQHVGSRSVTVETSAEYFGSAKKATAAKIDPKAVIAIVTDIVRGYRGRAIGILQPVQAGFPSVVTSGNGTPGFTFDLQTPPTTVQHELLRRGSGAKVKKGQTILLQVQGVAWTNPAATETFTSTWTDNKEDRPVTTVAESVTKQPASILAAGAAKALIGQTVGSQVLVVLPKSDGYPSGKAPTGYPTGETLVLVYDILGIE